MSFPRYTILSTPLYISIEEPQEKPLATINTVILLSYHFIPNSIIVNFIQSIYLSYLKKKNNLNIYSIQL